jgi:hypothetical protein
VQLAIFFEYAQGFLHAAQIGLEELGDAIALLFAGMAQLGTDIASSIARRSDFGCMPLSQILAHLLTLIRHLRVIEGKSAPFFDDSQPFPRSIEIRI